MSEKEKKKSKSGLNTLLNTQKKELDKMIKIVNGISYEEWLCKLQEEEIIKLKDISEKRKDDRQLRMVKFMLSKGFNEQDIVEAVEGSILDIMEIIEKEEKAKAKANKTQPKQEDIKKEKKKEIIKEEIKQEVVEEGIKEEPEVEKIETEVVKNVQRPIVQTEPKEEVVKEEPNRAETVQKNTEKFNLTQEDAQKQTERMREQEKKVDSFVSASGFIKANGNPIN